MKYFVVAIDIFVDMSKISPRFFQYWGRKIGPINRLKIQGLSMAGGAARIASVPLRSERLITYSENCESRVKRLQEVAFRDMALQNILDVVWVAEIPGLSKAVERVREGEDAAEVVQSLQFKFVFVSESAKTQRGYSSEEAVNQSLFEMVTPESLLKIMRRLAQEIKKEVSGEYQTDRNIIIEVDQILRDGTIMPVEIFATIIRDSSGRPKGLFGVTRDISARKLAEEALRRNKESVQALLDSTADSGFLVDPDGVIVAANNMAAKRGGVSLGKLIGMKISSVPDGASAEYEKMAEFRAGKLNEAIRDGRPVLFEDEYRGKSYEHRIWPIFDESGNVSQVAVFVRDVTEQRSLLNVTSEQRDLLLKLNAAKTLKEVYKISLDTALRLSGMDRGGVYYFIKEAGKLVLEYWSKEFSKEFLAGSSSYGLNDDHTKLVLAGQTVSIRVSDLPPSIRGTVEKEGLKYLIVVPIKFGKEVIGAFNIASTTREEIKDFELKSIEMIASQIGTAIVLHSTFDRLKGIFDHMESGVAIYRAVDDGNDFVFVDFNPAGTRMEQVKREDVIGKRVTEVFPGVKESLVLDAFRRVWKTGEKEFLAPWFYKDDRISGWRENVIFKLPSGEIVGVCEDVSEQKKSERRMEIMHELAVEVSKTLDVNDIFKKSLSMLKEFLTMGRGAV